MNLKPLRDQTVVITGASSGIGLATALEAARHGARLVLASRDPDDLERAAERVRAQGAEVETVVIDVADRAGVEFLADQAEARFGGFDTWVNNAGTSIFGPMSEVPEGDARQVFETNYWGVVHGSLVAAERFRRRRDGQAGCLINIGSVLSDRAVPLQGHYSASKHAVKGFTDSLRMELEKEGVPVVVSLVKPSAINTPYPEHAANYMDQAATLPPPVYAPEVVARTIVAVAERPTREITVGAGGRMLALMGRIAPRLTDKYMEAALFDQQKREDRPAERGSGHLQEPEADGAHVHGDAPRMVLDQSPYTWARMNPVATALGTAMVLGLGAVWASRR